MLDKTYELADGGCIRMSCQSESVPGFCAREQFFDFDGALFTAAQVKKFKRYQDSDDPLATWRPDGYYEWEDEFGFGGEDEKVKNASAAAADFVSTAHFGGRPSRISLADTVGGPMAKLLIANLPKEFVKNGLHYRVYKRKPFVNRNTGNKVIEADIHIEEVSARAKKQVSSARRGVAVRARSTKGNV